MFRVTSYLSLFLTENNKKFKRILSFVNSQNIKRSSGYFRTLFSVYLIAFHFLMLSYCIYEIGFLETMLSSTFFFFVIPKLIAIKAT